MVDVFYNVVKQDITIIRGDTLSFGFQLQGLEGVEPTEITFTVRETPDSAEEVFSLSKTGLGAWLDSHDEEKDLFTYGVRIPPGLTEGLTPGRYFYDLEVRIADDTFTFMKGRFIVEYDITR